MREVNPMQKLKALSLRLVTLPGSVREVRPMQPLNELLPMLVKPVGSAREVSPVHFVNAPAPMLAKPLGSVREVSPLQSWNELAPILVRVSGSAMKVSPPRQRNASSPIFSMPRGTVKRTESSESIMFPVVPMMVRPWISNTEPVVPIVWPSLSRQHTTAQSRGSSYGLCDESASVSETNRTITGPYSHTWNMRTCKCNCRNKYYVIDAGAFSRTVVRYGSMVHAVHVHTTQHNTTQHNATQHQHQHVLKITQNAYIHIHIQRIKAYELVPVKTWSASVLKTQRSVFKSPNVWWQEKKPTGKHPCTPWVLHFKNKKSRPFLIGHRYLRFCAHDQLSPFKGHVGTMGT